MKITHEIRDPVHVFVKLNSDERKILDKPVLQRLRHIHQLALSYLVYPGASHKRFEHSLGVMELAGRVFDIITNSEFIHEKVREMFPEVNEKTKIDYWRSAIRVAGLCHDFGHLPFSHASEKELLPPGWNHEKITIELIKTLEDDLQRMTPPLRALDVQKLAVGPQKFEEDLTNWEAILSEIIVGDCFGVDRMDYLIRDSLHTGVVYGKFDYYRLIDTLRILPKEYSDSEELYQQEPSDLEKNPEPGKVLYNALVKEFGEDNLRYDRYIQKESSTDFPVLRRNGKIVSSLLLSQALKQIPLVSIEYIFISRDLLVKAEKWLKENKHKILEEENAYAK